VTPPSQPFQINLGPPPPTPITPWPGTIVQLAAPANTSVAFKWLAGTGGPAATHYTLCVTAENHTCDQPGAALYPAPGQPAITGTTYVARLPVGFQGKRLQWSVAACGPPQARASTDAPAPGSIVRPLIKPPIALETCTRSAPRGLTWALPPPALGTPHDAVVTPRPTLALAQAVPGAERYLFCVSRLLATPGFVCPTEPTTTADTVVVDVTTQTFTAQSDLTPFDNQNVRWTAAACNAALGCVYQRAHRGLIFAAPQANISCSTLPGAIQVRNGWYNALVPRQRLDLSLTRLTPGGVLDGVALTRTGLGLAFYSPLPASVTHDQLTGVQASLDACHSFYARVSVSGRLEFPDLATFFVRSTYEFTRSPHVYLQLEIRLERAFGPVRVLPETSAQIWSLGWTFLTDARSAVSTTTGDVLVQIPDGPLGGLDSHLDGHLAGSPLLPIGTTSGWSRRVVSDGTLHDGHPAILTGSRMLLSNTVVSVDSTVGLEFSGDLQFFPTFGVRTDVHWFNDWNAYRYSIGNLGPIDRTHIRRQREDAIVRQTMFLIDRLALDGGWWKGHAWKSGPTEYPRGDRGATHSRSFPIMIYLWAHLALRRSADGWLYVPSDADLIYRQLQKAGPFLAESDPAPNLADRTSSGTRYIAYSQAYRERLSGLVRPRQVINAHSEALQFAWLMREASALARDATAERKWADVVTRFHPGSKAMFATLYPARDLHDQRRLYRGLIGYNPPLAELRMEYIDHAFSGIGAGYLEAGEYEPEFADVVEWASRENTNPFGDSPLSWAEQPYAARLTRVFPPALAFLRSQEGRQCPGLPPITYPDYWGPVMSADLGTASLLEVLAYDPGQPLGVHDPATVISEKRGRKWIRTNTRFLTYWSPGFWEPVDPSAVPANRRFDVVATFPTPAPCLGTNYSVSWSGNQILVMTDYSGGSLALDLPPGTNIRSVTRRVYRPATARWDGPQPAAGFSMGPGPGGKIRLNIGPVERKALVIVDVRP
jgi:hypothetical protein